MSESTALTIIAVSTLVMAVCVLAVTVATLVLVRAMKDVAARLQELSRQLQNSAVAAIGDLQASARAVGQAATVAVRLTRPLLAARMFQGMPTWLRRLGLVAGAVTAARQAFFTVSNVLADSGTQAARREGQPGS